MKPLLMRWSLLAVDVNQNNNLGGLETALSNSGGNMTDIKKFFIERLLETSVASSKEHLSKLGIEVGEMFDAIDTTILVEEMVSVCTSTGEELIMVDTFLNSDTYKTYEASAAAMAEVVFRKIFSLVEEKTTH